MHRKIEILNKTSVKVRSAPMHVFMNINCSKPAISNNYFEKTAVMTIQKYLATDCGVLCGEMPSHLCLAR